MARRILLAVVLSAVYLFWVTPLALLFRLLKGRPLPLRPNPAQPSYWNRCRVDSHDRGIYATEEFRSLSGVPALILRALTPWRGLAATPEGTELSSDLYVMF